MMICNIQLPNCIYHIQIRIDKKYDFLILRNKKKILELTLAFRFIPAEFQEENQWLFVNKSLN